MLPSSAAALARAERQMSSDERGGDVEIGSGESQFEGRRRQLDETWLCFYGRDKRESLLRRRLE
jgi:hypothetical protein